MYTNGKIMNPNDSCQESILVHNYKHWVKSYEKSQFKHTFDPIRSNGLERSQLGTQDKIRSNFSH